jgi:hypothetical protein
MHAHARTRIDLTCTAASTLARVNCRRASASSSPTLVRSPSSTPVPGATANSCANAALSSQQCVSGVKHVVCKRHTTSASTVPATGSPTSSHANHIPGVYAHSILPTSATHEMRRPHPRRCTSMLGLCSLPSRRHSNTSTVLPPTAASLVAAALLPDSAL